MAKKDFKEYVCGPFCVFYKEGQKEEMACRGAEIAERLVLHKYIHPEELPKFKKDFALWGKFRQILGRSICATCLFQEKDCDFAADDLKGQPRTDIEPCGGFIFLALLIENQLIDISILEKML